MKKIICVLFLLCFSACSATSVRLGQIVIHETVCTEDLQCKTELANTCPKGGVFHEVKKSIIVRYSCNP